MPLYRHLWPSLREHVKTFQKEEDMLSTHKVAQSSLISLILLFEREPALAQAQIESYIESRLLATKIIFGLGGLFIGLCFGFMIGKV